MTTDIIERMKLIEVAEQEIGRRQAEMEAKIRKPAEAEKYRCEVLSEANKQRTVLEALALSEAISMKGDAEAFAIEVKAKAQATEMSMKADAWKDYQKAAKVSMWLEAIPKCAAEVAAPLSQVGRVTMIGYTDGPDGTLGPARMTGEVLSIMDKIPEAIENLTGRKIKMT